jgi:hypothetical protein
MNKAKEKKIKQITNFIINNITLAEVSALVIERATETAEFIVKNNLDPNNFESVVARKKLHGKIKNFKEEIQKEEEEGWFNNLINKIGLGDKKAKGKSHSGFTTKTKK